MILQEVFPLLGTLHEIEQTTVLDSLYPRVDGFRLNYVVSPRLNSNDSDLASNPLDRQILKHIRSQTDLIITTGLTARSENLKSSKFAPMLILTKTEADFEFSAVQEESTHAIYLTQKLGTDYPNSKALAIGINNSPVSEFASSFCHANTFGRAVLETGKTVAKEFAQSGLLSEVDLTVTGVTERAEAEMAASVFLTDLGLGSLEMLQLLNHENTWLFRFGAHSTRS